MYRKKNIREPTSLVCGHHFCHPCVVKVANDSKLTKDSAKCPTCRKAFTLEKTVTNLTLSRIFELVDDALHRGTLDKNKQVTNDTPNKETKKTPGQNGTRKPMAVTKRRQSIDKSPQVGPVQSSVSPALPEKVDGEKEKVTTWLKDTTPRAIPTQDHPTYFNSPAVTESPLISVSQVGKFRASKSPVYAKAAEPEVSNMIKDPYEYIPSQPDSIVKQPTKKLSLRGRKSGRGKKSMEPKVDLKQCPAKKPDDVEENSPEMLLFYSQSEQYIKKQEEKRLKEIDAPVPVAKRSRKSIDLKPAAAVPQVSEALLITSSENKRTRKKDATATGKMTEMEEKIEQQIKEAENFDLLIETALSKSTKPASKQKTSALKLTPKTRRLSQEIKSVATSPDVTHVESSTKITEAKKPDNSMNMPSPGFSRMRKMIVDFNSPTQNAMIPLDVSTNSIPSRHLQTSFADKSRKKQADHLSTVIDTSPPLSVRQTRRSSKTLNEMEDKEQGPQVETNKESNETSTQLEIFAKPSSQEERPHNESISSTISSLGPPDFEGVKLLENVVADFENGLLDTSNEGMANLDVSIENSTTDTQTSVCFIENSVPMDTELFVPPDVSKENAETSTPKKSLSSLSSNKRKSYSPQKLLVVNFHSPPLQTYSAVARKSTSLSTMPPPQPKLDSTPSKLPADTSTSPRVNRTEPKLDSSTPTKLPVDTSTLPKASRTGTGLKLDSTPTKLSADTSTSPRASPTRPKLDSTTSPQTKQSAALSSVSSPQVVPTFESDTATQQNTQMSQTTVNLLEQLHNLNESAPKRKTFSLDSNTGEIMTNIPSRLSTQEQLATLAGSMATTSQNQVEKPKPPKAPFKFIKLGKLRRYGLQESPLVPLKKLGYLSPHLKGRVFTGRVEKRRSNPVLHHCVCSTHTNIGKLLRDMEVQTSQDFMASETVVPTPVSVANISVQTSQPEFSTVSMQTSQEPGVDVSAQTSQPKLSTVSMQTSRQPGIDVSAQTSKQAASNTSVQTSPQLNIARSMQTSPKKVTSMSVQWSPQEETPMEVDECTNPQDLHSTPGEPQATSTPMLDMLSPKCVVSESQTVSEVSRNKTSQASRSNLTETEEEEEEITVIEKSQEPSLPMRKLPMLPPVVQPVDTVNSEELIENSSNKSFSIHSDDILQASICVPNRFLVPLAGDEIAPSPSSESIGKASSHSSPSSRHETDANDDDVSSARRSVSRNRKRERSQVPISDSESSGLEITPHKRPSRSGTKKNLSLATKAMPNIKVETAGSSGSERAKIRAKVKHDVAEAKIYAIEHPFSPLLEPVESLSSPSTIVVGSSDEQSSRPMPKEKSQEVCQSKGTDIPEKDKTETLHAGDLMDESVGDTIASNPFFDVTEILAASTPADMIAPHLLAKKHCTPNSIPAPTLATKTVETPMQVVEPKNMNTDLIKKICEESDSESENFIETTPKRKLKEEKERIAKTPPPSPAPPCIHLCYSGLDPSSVTKIVKFQKHFPSVQLSKTFLPHVTTHLIVAHDNSMCTASTLKYLYAVACGCWVISEKWISCCLQADKILPVEQYEMMDGNGGQAPKTSRLASRRLFCDFEVYCGDTPEAYKYVEKHDIEEIIQCSGGRLINKHDLYRPPTKKYRLVIIPTENVPEDLRECNYPILEIDWVIDSVEQFKLEPVTNHIRRTIDDLLLSRQGFPAEMLEPPDEDDSTSNTTNNTLVTQH